MAIIKQFQNCINTKQCTNISNFIVSQCSVGGFNNNYELDLCISHVAISVTTESGIHQHASVMYPLMLHYRSPSTDVLSCWTFSNLCVLLP